MTINPTKKCIQDHFLYQPNDDNRTTLRSYIDGGESLGFTSTRPTSTGRESIIINRVGRTKKRRQQSSLRFQHEYDVKSSIHKKHTVEKKHKSHSRSNSRSKKKNKKSTKTKPGSALMTRVDTLGTPNF